MPNSTRSTRSRNTKMRCEACKEPANDQMFNCSLCGLLWHKTCMSVNDIAAEQDQTIMCPKCHKPTAVSVANRNKVGSMTGSKASSISTSASSRTRKARLQLEQLEAQKALAMKRLELERREQGRLLDHQRKEAEILLQHRLEQEKQRTEIELEQRQLQLEQTVMEESFRLREIIALDDDEDDDGSVVSEQSSFSKVNKWKTLSSTVVASTDKAKDMDMNNDEAAAMTRTQAGQGGIQHPASITQGVLEQALAGISLERSYLEPSLGQGRRTENLVTPVMGKATEPFISNVFQAANSSGSVPLATTRGSQGLNCVEPISSFNSLPLVGSTFVNAPGGHHSMPNGLQVPMNRGYIGAMDDQFISTGVPAGQRASGGIPVRTNAPLVTSEQQQYYSPHRHPNAQQGQDGLAADWEGPSARQLAARHVMAKDLPPFAGNPEDWPLFISTYNNSTQACGFSDVENLVRLQRCLKGHALESVRSRLLLPTSVPHVIATLETLYGRPELIIHTLLQKVRNVPAPRQDRLETLIAFGIAVQNLSDHLEAGRQEAHLNNPMLLFELVEKLPAHMKLDWSLYKQRFVEVNLRTFSQYMQTMVRAATDVTLHYDPTQNLQRSTKEKFGKEKNFCGAHLADDTPASISDEEQNQEINYPASPSCLICKDPDHRVKDCKEFDKKTTGERWRVTQQLGLCRLCLGAHGRRPCKIRKQCDVEGCQKRHHPLLHSWPDSREQQGSPNDSEVGDHKNENKQMPYEEIASGSPRMITNHHCTDKTTLFRIIPITLYGNGRSISAYAFLDDGSEKTLIDAELIEELGIAGKPQKLCLQWTANVKRVENDSQCVDLEISGPNADTRHLLSGARTVSKLDLPKQSLRFSELARRFPYLKGLPIEEYKNAIPKILIGNDNAHVTSTLKIRDGQPGEPIAAKTRLGWTVYGYNQDRLV